MVRLYDLKCLKILYDFITFATLVKELLNKFSNMEGFPASFEDTHLFPLIQINLAMLEDLMALAVTVSK